MKRTTTALNRACPASLWQLAGCTHTLTPVSSMLQTPRTTASNARQPTNENPPRSCLRCTQFDLNYTVSTLGKACTECKAKRKDCRIDMLRKDGAPAPKSRRELGGMSWAPRQPHTGNVPSQSKCMRRQRLHLADLPRTAAPLGGHLPRYERAQCSLVRVRRRPLLQRSSQG